MPTVQFRFYEELNDHLPIARRKCGFAHAFDGAPAIKDVIEALGVPHTEIDLILVDGKSVRFSHRLRGGERVAVYPMFERFDIRPLHRLRPRPLRRTRFVADVHLGKLARSLRLLGFDTLRSPWRRICGHSPRCMSCNSLLRSRSAPGSRGLVPPRVFRRFRQFTFCPGCGRIYWRGTHFQRLERFIRGQGFAESKRGHHARTVDRSRRSDLPG
jgi:Mut7-C ubiquitin/Mut7-C RNAse domain